MDNSNVGLNAIKHHLGWIQSLLSQVDPPVKEDKLLKEVKRIGNSTLDLYYGDISIPTIKTEVVRALEGLGVRDQNAYASILQKNGGYLVIPLSDTSTWTLRLVEGAEFIHIHPSRYSAHSIRTNGRSLKSAIMAVFLASNRKPALNDVNNGRDLLQLPPLTKILKKRGIGKLLNLFDYKQ